MDTASSVLLLLSITFLIICITFVGWYAMVIKKADVFSPIIQFLFFFALVTLPLPVRSLFTQEAEGNLTEYLFDIIPYMPYSLFLATVGLLLFQVAYYSRLARTIGTVIPLPPEIISRPRVLFACFGIVLFSLSLLFVLAQQVGGVYAFMLMGYSSSEATTGRGYLSFGFPWLFVGGLFLLASYAIFRRKTDIVLFGFLLIFLISLNLLMGNRIAIVYMISTTVLFFHYSIKPIKIKKFLPIAIIFFLVLNIFGYLRGANYADFDNIIDFTAGRLVQIAETGELEESFLYTITKGHFQVPFESLPMIVRYIHETGELQFGASYLKAPIFFIPQAIFPERPLSLGMWYMDTFYGGYMGANQGRTFYFLSEGYLNFGPAGVLITMYLWGIWLGCINSLIMTRKNNTGLLILAALTVAYLLRCISGDFSVILVAIPLQSLFIALLGVFIATGFRRWRGASKLP